MKVKISLFFLFLKAVFPFSFSAFVACLGPPKKGLLEFQTYRDSDSVSSKISKTQDARTIGNDNNFDLSEHASMFSR